MDSQQTGRPLAAILVVAIGCFATAPARAALMIPDVNSTYTIDFDNDLPGVNNGPYAGSGFSSNPEPGQLDSDAWAVTSFEEEVGGDLNFGEENTGDAYTRGVSTGGVTLMGLYSFDISNGGEENFAFGIQAIGLNWAPGTLTLRMQNTSGQEITEFSVAYNVYVRNDTHRANSFNFSHSADDSSYVAVSDLDFTSPEAVDVSPTWLATPRSTTISGLSIPHNAYYYLRWSGTATSGAQDEFALDDIVLRDLVTESVATPEPTAVALAGVALLGLAGAVRRRASLQR